MAFTTQQAFLFAGSRRVPFVQSPNHGAVLQPKYLIMHYTAGTTARGAISWFANPAAEASAHLVIAADGSVTQMVPFDRIAWHAGKSSWAGENGLNAHSIGIELVNAGKLVKRQSGAWVNWSGASVPATRVTVLTHKQETTPAGWELYPAKQIEVAAEIAIALHATYSFSDVLGHEDVSPHRKVDPGPAFPMLSFASKVLGRK